MATNGVINGSTSTDHATHQSHQQQRKYYDYGGNPLAREDTSDSARLPAFGGNLQPGTFKEFKNTNIANPAPLGLCAFAFTTFLLSLINIGVQDAAVPNIVVAAAFAYGGLVQLLAGMWEMACGNTFGATALSSYGGFWISFAIIFTPGGFDIVDAYSGRGFYVVFSFYLFGWFIFTTLLLMATLRSTVAFFLLFFFLDITFLLLALGYYLPNEVATTPMISLNKAGGYFGLFAAFMAWYNALAGVLDKSNSFFLIPVVHFPWSEKGRADRGKPKLADLEKEKSGEKSS